MKRLLLLALVLVMTMGLVSCGGSSTGEDEVVYFRYPLWVYYDLVFLAYDIGLFDDAGVRPDFVGYIDPGQMVPALVSGDLHVITRHTPLIISALEAGADIKIFASGSKSTQEHPHMHWFVRSDSDIWGVEDMETARIGMNSPGACSELLTRWQLRESGLSDQDISMFFAPSNELELLLQRDDVDVAIIHPLASGRAAANTQDYRVLFNDYHLDGGIAGMCPYSVNGRFLRENPEAITELIEILSEAARWNNANPEEARQLMADRFGFELEHTEMLLWYEDQIIELEKVEFWYDLFIDQGLVNPNRVAITDIFTNEFNPAYRGE